MQQPAIYSYGVLLTLLPILLGCGDTVQPTLSQARAGFTTTLLRQDKMEEPVEDPPADLFRKVQYPGPLGAMAAYVSPSVLEAKQPQPVIIWLTGGFSNSISSFSWMEQSADNDQSASQYRQAGVAMMLPSLRGGNDNPGYIETLYGEVDDVLAAIDWLSQQPGVDPQRIYLGGHSTGGTLALLVAESTDRLRTTFSFGPASDPAGYGEDSINYDWQDDQERAFRAPIYWLEYIQTPTFVLEGEIGNAESLVQMRDNTTNANIHFRIVPDNNHFSILAPMNRFIARKIVSDTGPEAAITITDTEIAAAIADDE